MSKITLEQVSAFAALVATLAPVARELGTLVFGVVRSVEANLPQSTGTQKFDAAMTSIKAFAGPLVDAAPTLFQELVNGTVATLNAIGEFKKAGQPSSSASSGTTT